MPAINADDHSNVCNLFLIPVIIIMTVMPIIFVIPVIIVMVVMSALNLCNASQYTLLEVLYSSDPRLGKGFMCTRT